MAIKKYRKSDRGEVIMETFDDGEKVKFQVNLFKYTCLLIYNFYLNKVSHEGKIFQGSTPTEPWKNLFSSLSEPTVTLIIEVNSN